MEKKGKVVPLLDTRNNIGGGFKNFRRNSLGKFTEIANVNIEIYTEILRRLRNMVRRKRHENRTTNHWVFSTTVLQHTRRFWSTISQQRITWKHYSIPHFLLTWLQLIFTYFLDRNQHWRGGAFVMLLTSLRMWRKSWKGFHETASRNVSNTFPVAGKKVYLHKGAMLKET